jgi:PTS system mannose-specific IIA component
MVGFVLVSHGGMAKGTLEALEMISGPAEQMAAFGLYEGESPESLGESIREQLPLLDDGSGVIFFVDMFGASPFNTCARIFLENQQHYALICGMNLPMLLELGFQREGASVQELAQAAIENGKDSITRFELKSSDDTE